MFAQEIIHQLARTLQLRQTVLLVPVMAGVARATAAAPGNFEPYHIAGLAW